MWKYVICTSNICYVYAVQKTGWADYQAIKKGLKIEHGTSQMFVPKDKHTITMVGVQIVHVCAF